MEYFESPERATENIEGPFYTVEIGVDCGCGLPESVAPLLLKTTDDRRYQTYFTKQPSSPEEIHQAIEAINICPIHEIRYGGKNPEIIKLVNSGQSDYIINSLGQVVIAAYNG